ncbi:hypothetical protein AB833_07105 [Chromatiales bacterium (ex Bugula neritina AB1)]|nr:hypothetical protein AB833_07105 [Chromatiales bacterium (ex Bugula neritina AB1)]
MAEKQTSDRKESRIGNKWIGVDLDGTLAQWDGWKGHEYIGAPIPAMLERVKRWLKMDIEVRIFTARASVAHHIPPVEKWLSDNGLPGLKVTNQKDYKMLQLWDDRCVQVIPNTGELVKNANWTPPSS